MVELPQTMRDLFVDQLDEYCETLDDTSDTEAIAEHIVELLETLAAETGGVEDDLVGQLEASGELEASLLEVLQDAFESDPDFEYTGEEIVSLIEKLCEIEWLSSEDEEDELPAGFFDHQMLDEDDD